MNVTTTDLKRIYAEKGSINGVAKHYDVNYVTAHTTLIEHSIIPVTLTADEVAYTVRAFNQGCSALAIRKKIHKQSYEISHVLRTHPGVTRELRQGPKKKLTKEAELDICRRYMERERIVDICADYKFDRKYLYAVLNRNGVSKDQRKYRKKCKKCGKTDQETAFHPTLAYECMECRPDPVARTTRNKYYKRTYGIDLDDYDRLLVAQGNKCALCGHDEVSNGRKLAVDHEHNDKASVRGLLCVNCNVKLGIVEGAGLDLHKAIAYLENPPAKEVLEPTDDSGQGLLF